MFHMSSPVSMFADYGQLAASASTSTANYHAGHYATRAQTAPANNYSRSASFDTMGRQAAPQRSYYSSSSSSRPLRLDDGRASSASAARLAAKPPLPTSYGTVGRYSSGRSADSSYHRPSISSNLQYYPSGSTSPSPHHYRSASLNRYSSIAASPPQHSPSRNSSPLFIDDYTSSPSRSPGQVNAITSRFERLITSREPYRSSSIGHTSTSYRRSSPSPPSYHAATELDSSSSSAEHLESRDSITGLLSQQRVATNGAPSLGFYRSRTSANSLPADMKYAAAGADPPSSGGSSSLSNGTSVSSAGSGYDSDTGSSSYRRSSLKQPSTPVIGRKKEQQQLQMEFYGDDDNDGSKSATSDHRRPQQNGIMTISPPSQPRIAKTVSFAPTPPSSSLSTSAKTTSKAGLIGLQNIGNTCFMNCVLQCLSHTKPMRDLCLREKITSDVNNNTSRMKGALIKAWYELINQLWSETSRSGYVTPDHFKSQIQKFAPRFVGYSQQDAQEFLRYLLTGLHEDVNRASGGGTRRISPLPPIDDTLNDGQKAAEGWKRYLRTDNSRVVDVFVGQLKSELRCNHCDHVSTTFDPFWDLSLSIPSGGSSRSDGVSLLTCLDAFTREEVLDGEEKPKCEKCKAHRRCTKRLTIFKYPQILVIHLKRFSGERYRSRLSTLVSFPLVDLDLTKYSASKSSMKASYNLYGVANHIGTALSGHYTAYVRHAVSNNWYLFDDTKVKPLGENNGERSSMVASDAYVLFYEAVHTAAQPRL